MNTSTFDHKFKLNETVYFQTDHGVNKGLVIAIYLKEELSMTDGKTYKYLSYGIIKHTQQHTVPSHKVFATAEEAFK